MKLNAGQDVWLRYRVLSFKENDGKGYAMATSPIGPMAMIPLEPDYANARAEDWPPKTGVNDRDEAFMNVVAVAERLPLLAVRANYGHTWFAFCQPDEKNKIKCEASRIEAIENREAYIKTLKDEIDDLKEDLKNARLHTRQRNTRNTTRTNTTADRQPVDQGQSG
jgi:hypothetical protein